MLPDECRDDPVKLPGEETLIKMTDGIRPAIRSILQDNKRSGITVRSFMRQRPITIICFLLMICFCFSGCGRQTEKPTVPEDYTAEAFRERNNIVIEDPADPTAHEIYIEAINTHSAESQLSLAQWYFSRANINDLPVAMYWYTLAAEQGNAEAQYHLANYFIEGPEADHDAERAVYWWTAAARQGHPLAQTRLAQELADGNQIDQDLRQAVIWWEKAAEQGEPIAQFNLGYSYYHGLGVGQDHDSAFKWFSKSAGQGNIKAQDYFGTVLS